MYQHLLRAAKNASPPQPRAAMLVLREMRRRGEEPAATHYNLVVCACARAAATAASTSALLPLGGDDAKAGSVALQGAADHAARDALARQVGVDNVARDPVARQGSVDSFARDADDDKSRRLERSRQQQDIQSAPLVSETTDDGHREGAKLTDTPAVECVDENHDAGVLSPEGKGTVFRGAETARDSWCLALEVLADMRKRNIMPTEVTFKTMVECCRCAAAAPLPKSAGDGGGCKGSSPAEIYTALKDAGVPLRFCYQAGLENALKGGRIFPEYVAELRR